MSVPMYVHPKSRDSEPVVDRRRGVGASRIEYPEVLAEVGVREFGRSVSRFLAQAEREGRLIVTKQRRPIAVILSVEEAEDFFLAYAPELVRIRLEGREEQRMERTIPLEEFE